MSETTAQLVERFSAGFLPDVPPPYNLRDLCRGVGRVPGDLPDLPSRLQLRRLGSRSPRRVSGAPAEVWGVIDGIQPAARALCWRGGRPIGFIYVAAGCIHPPTGAVRAHEERLLLVASHLDESWVAEVSGGVPVAVVRERYPAELVEAINAIHRRLRHRLERDVLAAVRTPGRLVVADGHLADIPPGAGAVAGVVKSHPRQYLGDEREVASLREGELSTPFLLPAVRDGELDRCSAYLRLHPAEGAEWSHGLIRLEASEERLLEPVAAWALRNRQGPGPDRRWAVHLAAMAACEASLRSRVPPILA